MVADCGLRVACYGLSFETGNSKLETGIDIYHPQPTVQAIISIFTLRNGGSA
jgi:hypothetical protein